MGVLDVWNVGMRVFFPQDRTIARTEEEHKETELMVEQVYKAPSYVVTGCAFE
jgi:hypothetical protein